MTDERRAIVEPSHGSRDALAILYTLGYLSLMGALMFYNIPVDNKELMLTLAGIMSAAQLGIIKYYYDGSKGAEAATTANIARSARSDATLQDIAKTVPVAAAAQIVATSGSPSTVTPAAPLPDGTIPAAKAEQIINGTKKDG